MDETLKRLLEKPLLKTGLLNNEQRAMVERHMRAREAVDRMEGKMHQMHPDLDRALEIIYRLYHAPLDDEAREMARKLLARFNMV